jgi:pantoate--beta-alanine ligase
MLQFHTSKELQNYLSKVRSNNQKIGFVPTLGALHDGHISLIKACQSESDISVVSIFVNPTQFNNPQDFEKYPRNLDADISLLQKSNCDILFTPSVENMYQNPNLEIEHIDIGYLDDILEGAKRPGHYIGVVTIVEKLLRAIQPDTIYMGLKDYQQVKVAEKLIREKRLPVTLCPCPTVREQNGLAMSSRNTRLSVEGKVKAGQIYNALRFVIEHYGTDAIQNVIEDAKRFYLSSSDFELEYFEVRDAKNLNEFEENEWVQPQKIVVLIAVWLEGVRLIDNMETELR